MGHVTANGQPTRSARTPVDLAARLRAVGQRVTPQRLMILGVFAHRGEHLTAEEVYARVELLSPALNRSTVYRTLELFRDLGLISETDLGGGVRHYELLDDGRHHHLVCHGCGAMIELDDALVEPLRARIHDQYGFAAGIEHLALFGWCAVCEGGRRKAEKTRKGELVPKYDYACDECGACFERERPMAEAADTAACPVCDGAARRVFTMPKLLFKADPRDVRPYWHNHDGYSHQHAPRRGRHRLPSEEH